MSQSDIWKYKKTPFKYHGKNLYIKRLRRVKSLLNERAWLTDQWALGHDINFLDDEYAMCSVCKHRQGRLYKSA